MIKKGTGNDNCRGEPQTVKTLGPSLGSFSGAVARKFFLGVLDDCTIETNSGARGELYCILLKSKISGRRIFKLLPPTFFLATLSKC